jgi:iron-sulfur cluster assembly accessory protein
MRESSRPLLRVYLEGKGCDGFYYGVAFDTEQRPDDTVLEINGLTIVVDKDSLSFMEGSKVVWVDDERGRGFLVENPNQRAYRGKFYKRKDWQARQNITEQTRPSE